MKTEHKIILSMYYENEDNSIDKTESANLCVGMDMTQLLLILADVFNLTEYEFKRKEDKIAIVPASDKMSEYELFVDNSHPVFREAKILKVEDASGPLFDSLDYQKIDGVSTSLNQREARRNLFSLNILTEWINHTYYLTKNRKNFIYYRLFSIKGGKRFVSLLIYFLLELTREIARNDMERAKEVLSCINHDYNQIKKIFQERKTVLEDLEYRELMRKDKYENIGFINEVTMFAEWLQKQRNAFDVPWINFMFFDNEMPKTQAIHLMQHIIRIVDVFFSNSEIVLWQEIRQDICFWHSDLREFQKADSMVDELEREYLSNSFNIINWANLYGKYISEIRDELNL